MSEMVDHIANTIYIHTDVDREQARKVARMVIEAMREPTEATILGMREAGIGGEIYSPDDYKEAWRLGIDAALKEPAKAD